MIGDKWWGYKHKNGVVTISPQEPQSFVLRSTKQWTWNDIKRVVGPFEESLEDVFEGDNKMVRRKIMAALDNQPLDEAVQRDSA